MCLAEVERCEKIVEEHGFFSGFCKGKVFTFHAGKCNSVNLFSRAPDDGCAIGGEDVAREQRSSGSDAPDASEYP